MSRYSSDFFWREITELAKTRKSKNFISKHAVTYERATILDEYQSGKDMVVVGFPKIFNYNFQEFTIHAFVWFFFPPLFVQDVDSH